MTQQLSITLDDELGAQIRANAGGNISEWVATAARQRLAREMWERSKQADELLGIGDPEWMAREIASRDQAQRAAR
jgi:hypothetical protein